jgi:hypothetical protein
MSVRTRVSIKNGGKAEALDRTLEQVLELKKKGYIGEVTYKEVSELLNNER